MEDTKQQLLARTLGAYLNVLGLFAPQKSAALAHRFFSRPRYGRLDASALPDVLQQAIRSTLSSPHGPITCYEWGSGPRVLLLHGWESNSARWERLLPFLEGFHVMAVDAPGHGLDPGIEFNAPLYAAFADRVSAHFQPEFIIGHSMGGISLLYLLHRYPMPAVKKAVVMGAPSEMTAIVANFTNQLKLSAMAKQAFDTFIESRYGFRPSEFSGAAFASTIPNETLVIHATDDDIVPFAEGERVAGALPNGHFLSVEGCGHRMHDDVMYGHIRHYLLS